MRGHRWFAAVYDRLCNLEEKSPRVRKVRREVVGGARGRVLEIGAGTGASFRYYTDAATEVVAIEPDPFMLQRARKAAARATRPISLHQVRAEDLPFDDASFDTVVSALVLCTVLRPDKALSEIKRVLKPGGQLRVYEHVRYDHAFGAFWQDLVTPAWRWFGAGCNPNRDTARNIRDAGFEFSELRAMKDAPPIPPMAFVRPHIVGVATVR